ncbi:MAG: TetR/AcrR family transcriptional regulator [Eubacteriaceae bacterium]|nr:TetR/AcrR family transcriptional regulator [Eubacteriaceae bacterium]
MNTKDRIIKASLDLFSKKGFDPVSVRDIAGAVGIKESSLYNHFKNKQDIFDTILKGYSDRWDNIFSQLQLSGDDAQFSADERTINMYKNMTNENFKQIVSVVFDYYMTDEINVKFRRMLTIEQYRNEDIAKLYRKISFDDSIEYQAQLFEGLIKAGCFIEVDPYILAIEFFSPIFLIFYKYENTPQQLQDAKELFLRHIDHFNEIYGKNTQKEE